MLTRCPSGGEMPTNSAGASTEPSQDLVDHLYRERVLRTRPDSLVDNWYVLSEDEIRIVVEGRLAAPTGAAPVKRRRDWLRRTRSRRIIHDCRTRARGFDAVAAGRGLGGRRRRHRRPRLC